MHSSLPLPQEKKLTVLYRVEAGCLGPEGGNHIDKFCQYAGHHSNNIDTEFIHWEIIPRHDKSLPEIQYQVNNKYLCYEKARKYLKAFDKELEGFESELENVLATLIDDYWER